MKYQFGEKIREVRERKNITLREVAGKAGLSESLISQIERNKVSPAIDTLLKIADILDIDLDYLFIDFKKERAVNLVRFSERNKIILNGIVYEQLTHTSDSDGEHAIEVYFLEVMPGGEKGSYDYGHKGKELGTILEGTGEFKIGNKSYILNKGDSISFSADVPHILKNIGKEPLKAFWVTTPPKKFING